jgi:hypothetical protein
MSYNTFGDIDSFRHNPYAFFPGENLDDEEDIDWFTHSRTDNTDDLLPKSEIEDMNYGEGLGHLADETLDDDPDLLIDA